MQINKLLYSVNETAELVGLSRITIYRKLKTKEWPSVRINRRLFVSQAFLENLIKSNDSNPEKAEVLI